MPEHILFLTGKLAESRLHQVLDELNPTDFSYSVQQIGIKVAGLMTSDLIRHRLKSVGEAQRIIVPGRCRGDLDALTYTFKVPFERGPDELRDLPEFFGREAAPLSIDRHETRIFAEITNAPHMDVDAIIAAAAYLSGNGADVIDLGCLPATPFPHLEDAVSALINAGHTVSVDSADPEELVRGGNAGAAFLLSLTEDTLWVADRIESVPVVIPARHGDMDSLCRAVEALRAKGKACLADPILDPINCGFTDSLRRYHDLRKRLPDAEILMGIGNLTELTDADSGGVTAMLMGIAGELRIGNVLVAQVSPHCRRAVREADQARRLMFAARQSGGAPNRIDDSLMSLHDRKPFPYSSEEIAETAAMISDPSIRVEISEDGIHAYNRDGHHVAGDPFELFSRLDLECDASHAFYIGVESARAQIAWQLGKRYIQDTELDWGCAVAGDRPPSLSSKQNREDEDR